jgi:hypothetical protein
MKLDEDLTKESSSRSDSVNVVLTTAVVPYTGRNSSQMSAGVSSVDHNRGRAKSIRR